MSKRRKTRQQKQIADLRRQLHHLSSAETSNDNNQKSLQNNGFPHAIHLPPQTFADIAPSKTASITYTNPYLKKDLLKTVLIVSAVVVFELLLMFLLKQQIIRFPFVNF